MKKVIKFIKYIFIFVITLLILKDFITNKVNENAISKEKIKNREIKSIIYKKSIDYDNHSIPYIIFNRNDSVIIYDSWWGKIEVGDSIIKPIGSLELLIKNTHKIEKLNYEEEALPLLLE